MRVSFRSPFVDAGLLPYRSDDVGIDIAAMFGDGDLAAFRRVGVLAMATLLGDKSPSVREYSLLDFLEFHTLTIRIMRAACQARRFRTAPRVRLD